MSYFSSNKQGRSKSEKNLSIKYHKLNNDEDDSDDDDEADISVDDSTDNYLNFNSNNNKNKVKKFEKVCLSDTKDDKNSRLVKNDNSSRKTFKVINPYFNYDQLHNETFNKNNNSNFKITKSNKPGKKKTNSFLNVLTQGIKNIVRVEKEHKKIKINEGEDTTDNNILIDEVNVKDNKEIEFRLRIPESLLKPDEIQLIKSKTCIDKNLKCTNKEPFSSGLSSDNESQSSLLKMTKTNNIITKKNYKDTSTCYKKRDDLLKTRKKIKKSNNFNCKSISNDNIFDLNRKIIKNNQMVDSDDDAGEEDLRVCRKKSGVKSLSSYNLINENNCQRRKKCSFGMKFLLFLTLLINPFFGKNLYLTYSCFTELVSVPYTNQTLKTNFSKTLR